MDTIKKIYEGWAKEKYPLNPHCDKEILEKHFLAKQFQKEAYTAALEDRLEDVSCEFLAWFEAENIDEVLETKFKNINQSFRYFINNIYGK